MNKVITNPNSFKADTLSNLLEGLRERLPLAVCDQHLSHSDVVEPAPAAATRPQKSASKHQRAHEWTQYLALFPHSGVVLFSVPGLGEVSAVHAAVAGDQLEVAAAMLQAFPRAHLTPKLLFDAFIELVDRPLAFWLPNVLENPVTLPQPDIQVTCDTSSANRLDVMRQMLAIFKNCTSFSHNLGVLALCCSAMHGNWQAVELLLIHGVSPNRLDGRGWSPLHYAVGPSCTAAYEDIKITCSVLLSHGAQLEIESSSQANTPMLTAAWGAKPAVLKWLLDQGAKITATNSRGSGVLHSIVSYSEAAAGEFYVACRLSAFDRRSDSAYVPATDDDLATCIKACFDAGLTSLEANQGNYHGTVPLLWAALSRRPAALAALCEAGANPRISDNNGTSALHALASVPPPPCYACAARSALGADTSLSSADSACDEGPCAAFQASCASAVRILVKYGAGVNSTSAANHVTPLMNAAASGNLAVAAELLKAGADPTIVSSGMSTALHYCCNYIELHDHEEVGNHGKMLRSGQTALPGAQSSVDAADRLKAAIAVQILRHPNCAPNARDTNGFTPVLMAAWGGLPRLLHTLLAHPAVDNLVSVQGWRLFHVLGMLKAAGADKQLAQCVKLLHRAYPPQEASLGACIGSCWRFVSGASPPRLALKETVATASGPRTAVSLAAECLRPATVQAMFDCGAQDGPQQHSIGTARCIHFVVVGKRLAGHSCPKAACALARTLTSSFRRSSRITANTLVQPHLHEVTSSWKELPQSEEHLLTSTLLLFMRRGEDLFEKTNFFWPVMQHARPRRKLKWCLFDYLVAGGFTGALTAVHSEVTWVRRKGLLLHRTTARANKR